VVAGHDPSLPMHVYRGRTLALKVRSIGEGARLAIRGDGVGFRFEKSPSEGVCGQDTAPPVRLNKHAAMPDQSRRTNPAGSNPAAGRGRLEV
jgi:hypothetical protein